MQLFSIGLYKLNADGTRQRDQNDDYIRAYTNDDILEYAKVYTGFRRQFVRGNIESSSTETSRSNYIDPMYIRMDWKE